MSEGLEPDSFWRQTFRTYRIVLAGRARGHQERIITLAHQIEAMSRQGKRFKASPQDYIRAASRSDREGASAVLAMLRRFKDRQDKAGAKAP